MRAVAPEAGFSFETICEIPSFLGSPEDAVTRLAQRLAGEQRTTLVAFGTEAGLFKNAGLATLEQLGRCAAFMRGLAQASSIS